VGRRADRVVERLGVTQDGLCHRAEELARTGRRHLPDRQGLGLLAELADLLDTLTLSAER
jgi:hypothetical protein